MAENKLPQQRIFLVGTKFEVCPWLELKLSNNYKFGEMLENFVVTSKIFFFLHDI
jgi:hypothetical protein